MKRSLKKNNQNLLNLFLIALTILMTFGCRGAIQDFKKGFNESYDKRKGSTDTTSTPDGSGKTNGTLADDIVGSWEMTANNQTLIFNFTSGKKVESFLDGKQVSSGTYFIVDENTIGTKNANGTVIETAVKVQGDKMTMTYQNRSVVLTRK